MDDRQHCVYMNPAAEALTGYDLVEVLGRPLHDVVHHTRPDGSHYPLAECPIDRAFPENNREQGEEVFVHKDGSFYPVAYTASPIREEGVIVGTIIEVRDIRAEKEARAALHESEAVLSTILEHLPVGVALFGHDGRINRANEAMRRFFGDKIPSADAAEAWRWEAAGLDGRPLQPHEFPGARALRGESVLSGIRFRYRQEDGTGIWTRVSAVPLRDRAGNVRGAIAVVIDIDQEQRAQEAVAALLSEKERLAHHNELVAREISHRIINSFNLLASLLALEMRDIQDPAARTALERARERVQAVAVVQRRLFQAMHEDVGTLDLGEYLQGLARELVASFVGERCAVRVDAPASIAVPTAQASSLGMIVTELVINACKHAFKERENGRLGVRVERTEPGRCRLTIEDDGPGLPADQAPGGSGGLGMRLVRSLVQQIDGSLAINSGPPGTRFEIVFPA
jgi:PAS domain S-box-containing protein